uniref:Transmembrane protein 217 isoform X2 n=1 Tax=Phascolarctos cinereus TaxID=38626 RepID=A0A6P5LBH3_PHACI|nr:transmembrane protein 217 isoform X2 [Phascolarctos cinereus]
MCILAACWGGHAPPYCPWCSPASAVEGASEPRAPPLPPAAPPQATGVACSLLGQLAGLPQDPVRPKGMFWLQKCKMSPRLGSFMAGIFTIFLTIQSLILDLNQTSSFGKDPNKFNIYKELRGVVFWAFSHKNNITIFLSITTLLASCFLLYSVHMKLYLGLFIYILWIITYEITCFSLILLISQAIQPPFLPIKHFLWINQISRMILQAFWLPFVMTYAYSLFKGPNHLAKKSPRTKKEYDTASEYWSHIGIMPYEQKLT